MDSDTIMSAFAHSGDWQKRAPAASAVTPVRKRLLDDAAALTLGARNVAYGDPFTNMRQTANLFNTVSGHRLTPAQAALFMVTVKLARLRTTPAHTDSVVDAIAYMAIYGECVVRDSGEDDNA